MMRLALLFLVVGCYTSQPPPQPPQPAPYKGPPSCPTIISGTVHDLDHEDATIPGATLEIGKSTLMTNARGVFVLEDVTQPLGKVTAYYADWSSTGVLPTCANKMLWIGMHTTTAELGQLVVKTDGPIDVAGLQRASQQRDVLADEWMAFYEQLGTVVETNHATCVQLADALEQFVTTNRAVIDQIRQQRETMPAIDRDALRERIDHKFAERSEALRAQMKPVNACQSEPRVRRALRDVPH